MITCSYLGVAGGSGVLPRENFENWRSPDTIFRVLDHIFPPFVRGKIGRYDFTRPDKAAYAAGRIFTRTGPLRGLEIFYAANALAAQALLSTPGRASPNLVIHRFLMGGKKGTGTCSAGNR